MRVQALNTNDWSELSEFNTFGAIIQTIPYQMEKPTRNYETWTNLLWVDWVALSGDSTGSAEIDSYNLQWDAGTDGASWSDLIGFDPFEVTLSGQFTDGVVEGTYYQMRVRAHNVHGWGPFSEVLSIKAAGRPL